ncbi:MAG TPA: dienelactone hydrolase family protein, partial [Acidobacteriota bacterium]|nr:dienelactone hydrolase family protein [Acidobacteriota bacterium]
MTKTKKTPGGRESHADREHMRQLWEEHVRHEFTTHNTDDTLATMVADAYVNHIPVLTGGSGRDEL